MTEHDALYQAVLASPDDDLPRLVYADWLEEHGRPDTAAFIRTQIELARVPPWNPLWVRCHHHGRSAWLTGRGKRPPKAATPRGFRWESNKYRRGFPCRVVVSNPVTAAKNADAMFAAAPVDDVRVEMLSSRKFAPLLSHPRMGNVRRLAFGYGLLTAEQVRPLLDSPHARGLTELNFWYRAEPEDALRALLRSPLTVGLKRLHATGHGYEPPTTPLAAYEGANLPRLEAFIFRSAPSFATVRRILASAHLPRLEQLNLCEVPVGTDGIGQLNAWAGCGRVTSLNLLQARLNGAAIEALAAGGWSNLRELILSHNSLGPRAVQALVGAKWMPGLRSLVLIGNRVGDRGAEALAASPAAGGLVVLSLGDTGVTDRGAKAILDSPHLGNLAYLNLQGGTVSEGMAKALRKRFGATAVDV